MNHLKSIFYPFLSVFLLAACGGGGNSSDNQTSLSQTSSSVSTQTSSSDSNQNDSDQTINYFNASSYSSALISEVQVDCELTDGTSASCLQITFMVNGAGSTEGSGSVGPFCPPSVETPRSESGLGIYDGVSNPGFQSIIDAALNMEADGLDIVDEDGNIRTDGRNGNACLAQPFIDNQEAVYLIPATPKVRTEPYYLGTIEKTGFGVNGVPYVGDPPGVTVTEAGIGGSGSGNIPALDHCGGHSDPADNTYHWHFVPQSMNLVLGSNAYNYTESYNISCSNSFIETDAPASFAGLAKDGFPIYGALDSSETSDIDPSEVIPVDECNGHEHTTSDFEEPVYHYHALKDSAPNLPRCLMGHFSGDHHSVR